MRKSLMLSLLLSYSVVSYSTTHVQTAIDYTMNYPMDSIVNRYCKDYNVSKEDALFHERELKRYLFLCAHFDQELGMFSLTIDELWHTFIIYTTEYKDFCKNVAGTFIHHVPREQDEQDIEGFNTFVKLYESTFGESLPSVWKSDNKYCRSNCKTCSKTCRQCVPNKQKTKVIEIN